MKNVIICVCLLLLNSCASLEKRSDEFGNILYKYSQYPDMKARPVTNLNINDVKLLLTNGVFSFTDANILVSFKENGNVVFKYHNLEKNRPAKNNEKGTWSISNNNLVIKSCSYEGYYPIKSINKSTLDLKNYDKLYLSIYIEFKAPIKNQYHKTRSVHCSFLVKENGKYLYSNFK